MKFLTKLFNKTQFKMEKLTLVLAAHAFYSSKANPDELDKKRLVKLGIVIDKETDALVKDIIVNAPIEKPASPEIGKGKHIDPGTPGASSSIKPADQKKLAEEKAKLEGKKPEEAKPAAPAEPKDETLIEVPPFYSCEVTPKGAKHSKPIKADVQKLFKVFKTEADAKKANNAYPSQEEFDLVMDEAWKLACEGKPTVEIKDLCKKELGKYYKEMKSDADWYAKLANPIVAMVGFLKKNFGYNVKDTSVSVTRPYEADLKLEFASDIMVKKEEKKPAETPAAKPAEEKKELKTVQEKGKPAEKPAAKPAVKIVDEEVQETEEDEEEDRHLDLGNEEEERDTTVPPAVNVFDEFSAFETLLFDKIYAASKAAAVVKDDAGKKAIYAENREEVRNLIMSQFEGEEWTEKTPEGKWNPKLVKYHNAILDEIQANRAKWSK